MLQQEIVLKNYQKKALHEINVNYANGVKSQLLIMATGTGKTVVFCEFIKELISVNKKVLVLVHRDELINQAERRLKLHTKELFGIEKAERKANNENIVLASVQTLKGKRLKKFAKDYFDVIIIDECHRSTANSYMAVRKHFNKAHVLGVTATPERQDDLKITKKHFQKIAFTYNLLDAIKDGNLANIKVWRVESSIDISDVKSNSDDLDQKELAKVLDTKQYIEFIYKTIIEKALNKKIMVFMPKVETSDKLCEFLNSKGIQSFSVSSNTPLEKRQEVLEDYKKGKIQVLSNYNIFTEGFDEPSIDCVIMARPTKSLIFYSQALGRMTRLFEGKEYGMLIDIGFINNRHKIATIFDLSENSKETSIEIDNKLNSILKKYPDGADLEKCLKEYEIESKKLLKQYKKEEIKKIQLNNLQKKKYFDKLEYNEKYREFCLKEISIENFFYNLNKISSNLTFLNMTSELLEEKLIDIFKKYNKAKIFNWNGKSLHVDTHSKYVYELILKLSKNNIFLCFAYGGFTGKTFLYINEKNKRILLPNNRLGIKTYLKLKNYPYLKNETSDYFKLQIDKYKKWLLEPRVDIRKPAKWVKTNADKIRWIKICNKNLKNYKEQIFKYENMFMHWKKEKVNILYLKNQNDVLRLFKKYNIRGN